MRAMVQTDYSGPEAVFPQGVPEPMRGSRDVVEAEYRGPSRPDPVRLKGPGPTPGFRLPQVPGADFAGTVMATGFAVSPVVCGGRDIADPTRGRSSCSRCAVGDRTHRVGARGIGGNAPGAPAARVPASAETGRRSCSRGSRAPRRSFPATGPDTRRPAKRPPATSCSTPATAPEHPGVIGPVSSSGALCRASSGTCWSTAVRWSATRDRRASSSAQSPRLPPTAPPPSARPAPTWPTGPAAGQ